MPGSDGVDDDAARATTRSRALQPARHRRGHVLLDRDLALQRVVPAEVDDAAHPFADQPLDLVLAQTRSERQRVAGRCVRRAHSLDFLDRGHRDQSAPVGRAASVAIAAVRSGPGIVARAPPRDGLRGAARCATKSRQEGCSRAGAWGRQADGTSRRRNMPNPSIVSTVSSAWFITFQRERIMPTPGRLARGRDSSTSRRTWSVSPG